MKHALRGPQAARQVGKRRGATLLVSIAILTLLAVFSIAFVQLVNFERHASANYVDAVRARMAARAGVQRAIAELQRMATLKHYTDGREPWNYDYVQPAGLDRPLSLLTTQAPSFAMKDNGRALFGQNLYYSGAVSSSYQGGIDVYKLKIIDAASQLNVNHPDKPSITRMLKNFFLCAAQECTDGWNLTPSQAAVLAQAVIDRRPEGGFRSLSEVEQILSEPLLGANSTSNVVVPPSPSNPHGINRFLHPDRAGKRLPLRDMLTVSSWVDTSVIRPWNLNNDGRRDLELQPRAPINLNTAALPVLTAVLAELKGAGRFGSAEIPYDAARSLATAIRTRVTSGSPTGTVTELGTSEGPFKTWYEFERWLDGVAWSPPAGNVSVAPALKASSPIGSAAAGQLPRDLVKAALNPNSMLNKWGAHPNHGGSRHGQFMLPRLIDKADLIQHSTEGCFDAMGIYDITSIGLVLVENEREASGGGGTRPMLIVAEQTIQMVVRVYDVFRLTTQADFETNRALHAAGDFIEAFDRKWTYTVLGVNRPRYGPPVGETVPRSSPPYGFEGWAGVTSLPVYSLHRDTIDKNWGLRPEYEAADWDGYLMLSNLLAVPVQPSDFVVCFARGGFDAFKVRVWWEPKDQHPFSGEPLDPQSPTRGWDPGDFTDLQNLAKPMAHKPADVGKHGARNPLDAVAFGPDAKVTSPAWFDEGSALTPHGAIIHPNRRTASGDPAVLVYPGDNIDLIQGTSIRFWVMPLDDPYLASEEVLFSFVGSRDGQHRDVGFKVVKRASVLGDVRIFLETVNLERAGENDIQTGAQGSSLGRPNLVSIDVTPDEGVTPNPLRPQWTPGSWHWIVVNFGPQTAFPNVAQTAVLQVDKARGTALGTDIINMSVSGTGGPLNYGTAHGNQFGNGIIPGDDLNINRRGVVAWVGDRLLGEWYHCDYGRTVEAQDGSKTFPNAVVWDPTDGGGAGGWVIAPGFPANPFPDGSYNRKLTLKFRATRGQDPTKIPPDADMVPANGTGMGNTGWTHTFAPEEQGPDQTGGTADDYEIDIVASWTTDSAVGGSCTCCTDCGTHDMTRKRYWGRNNDNGRSICYMVHKGPGLIQAGGRLPPPGELPLQFTCDQCHGCEACDVDGPMFFGGEPVGRDNYSGGLPAPVNPATTARAIFDNIIIKNNKERRTDAPGGGGELPGKDFEDRFFETSLATVTGSTAFNNAADLNFGAVYRRGLLEVLGFRARLGTLTWTSYPTSDDEYDFQAALYRMPGGTGSAATYDPANPGPLNTRLGQPPTGTLYTMKLGGKVHQIGYHFQGEPLLDTTSDPTPGASWPKEILVLSVQFSKLLASVNDRTATGPGGKLYPQPLVETPIFEDVTLTLIVESPQILYAEEGVEE